MSPGQKFCSWLETQLVVTCTKVRVLLPGRAFIHGAVLWKPNQDTGQVQRGHPWLQPVPTRRPCSRGKPGALPARCHTPVPVTANCPSAHRKGQLLSLRSSALVSHHESPVTQGGILKQLAVKIGNKSLPFSLLEPSFLSHEKDGF